MILTTEDEIDVGKVLIDVCDNFSGATAIFLGRIRDHGSLDNVIEIHYEIYKEMAENILKEIEIETLMKWNIRKFVIIHRNGILKVGEISVIIAISSEHRNEALEACKYGIDNIKNRVPIWKKEISKKGNKWADGIPLVK